MKRKSCLFNVFVDYMGHMDITPEDFAKRKMSVQTRNIFDNTVLHMACEFDDLDSVRILIEAGADINAFGVYGETPLIRGIKCGSSPELVEYLLRNGASVESKDWDDDRPIHVAAREGIEYVRLLIDAGADVNAKGDLGYTALHFAVRNGDEAMVALLLSSGASVQADDWGDSPMDMAERNYEGYKLVCDELEKHTQ